MRRAFALVLLVAVTTGCVSKLAYPRVKSALVESGLSDANAGCMAGRMTDKLTIGQLRKLEALKSEKRSMVDYVAAVRRLSDSELISVTVSSAALCTTGLAR